MMSLIHSCCCHSTYAINYAGEACKISSLRSIARPTMQMLHHPNHHHITQNKSLNKASNSQEELNLLYYIKGIITSGLKS